MKTHRSIVAALAYAIVNMLMLLLYIVPSLNKPTPALFGLSIAFTYSLIVWLVLMALVVYVAWRVWR